MHERKLCRRLRDKGDQRFGISGDFSIVSPAIKSREQSTFHLVGNCYYPVDELIVFIFSVDSRYFFFFNTEEVESKAELLDNFSALTREQLNLGTCSRVDELLFWSQLRFTSSGRSLSFSLSTKQEQCNKKMCKNWSYLPSS